MDEFVAYSVKNLKSSIEEAKKEWFAEGKSVVSFTILGKHIAKKIWGQLWCKNLERYETLSPTLSKGRSLLKNGAIFSFTIKDQEISTETYDFQLYQTTIKIRSIDPELWNEFKSKKNLGLTSLVDLLNGNLSNEFISSIFDTESGIFPEAKQIKSTCSCIEDAMLCSHASAALYAFGYMLDSEANQFFNIIGVQPDELFNTKSIFEHMDTANFDLENLNDIFSIDFDKI